MKWQMDEGKAAKIKLEHEMEKFKIYRKSNNTHKRNNHKLKKTIRKRYDSIILIGLMMLSALMSGIFIGHAYGENYIYNMSKAELMEERILNACIELKINSPECAMIWGGIDTTNGEPVK